MNREFTDWVRTLDELKPKGVQQETRLAPTSQSPCPCCQHYKTCDVPTSSCGLMRMNDKRKPMPIYLAPPLRGEVKKQDWPFRIMAAFFSAIAAGYVAILLMYGGLQ